MTDHNAAEVARIAKKLTKAQRLAVIRGGGSTRTARQIFDARLYGSISYNLKARYAFLTRPSEIGLAVRAHLEGGL